MSKHGAGQILDVVGDYEMSPTQGSQGLGHVEKSQSCARTGPQATIGMGTRSTYDTNKIFLHGVANIDTASQGGGSTQIVQIGHGRQTIERA